MNIAIKVICAPRLSCPNWVQTVPIREDTPLDHAVAQTENASPGRSSRRVHAWRWSLEVNAKRALYCVLCVCDVLQGRFNNMGRALALTGRESSRLEIWEASACQPTTQDNHPNSITGPAGLLSHVGGPPDDLSRHAPGVEQKVDPRGSIRYGMVDTGAVERATTSTPFPTRWHCNCLTKPSQSSEPHFAP